MVAIICRRCCLSMHRTIPKLATTNPIQDTRTYFSASSKDRTPSSQTVTAAQTDDEIAAILSKPTWSVRSLLPSASTSSSTAAQPQPDDETQISSKTLHHLLRLSALSPPSSPEEETELLNTLSSQLHFVRSIQQVDTEGVEPLRAIRDETSQGIKEQTVGLAELKEALNNEDVIGHARRPRRRRVPAIDRKVEDWDVFANASETVGPFFVVRSGATDAESA